MAIQVLIGSDRDDMSRQIRDVLSKNALDCPAGYVVPLDSVADRAVRIAPSLMVLVAPPIPIGAAAVLREARRVAPNAYAVVVGPVVDEHVISRILDEGADEYLDQSILETELNGMVARFKSQAEPDDMQTTVGWVVAVLSPSGGSGASIAAANISASLAAEHGECGLIDLRFDAGDLPSMFDLRPTHSIADICDQLARIDRSMLKQFFIRHNCGVHLLAAPSLHTEIKRITAKGVRQTFVMARQRFPYVVTDMDNVIAADQVEALWQADTILLMLRLDYTSVRNTRRVLDNLTTLGIKMDRVRLVANGCGDRKQLTPAQAEEALGTKIFHSLPSEPSVILHAINNGIPAVLGQPSAKISRSLQQLAHSCSGHRLNGHTGTNGHKLGPQRPAERSFAV